MAKSNQDLIRASIDFACDKIHDNVAFSKTGSKHRLRSYSLCQIYEHRFDTTTPRNFFELFWDKAKEE